MDEKGILKTIETFAKKLPKFPDGRIDYSNSNTAPVITVFIKYEDRILLLKRSDKVSTYRGKWNTVAGYLDEVKPIGEKILEELNEEVGISESEILTIHPGKSYKYKDTAINKTWLVNPILIKLKHRPEIRLDWEHTEFKWIKPEELKNYDTTPKLEKSLKNAFD